MRTALKLERTRDLLFLIIFSFVFFLLRLPSLFEPNWYGHEGVYQVIGTALSNGSLLYRDIWDNKPPLLYLLYAIFNSDQFTLRLTSLIFGLLSVFVFFLLSKKLFPLPATQKTSFILTVLFIFLFATPFLEGNIANAENFMMFPILIAGFLIFNFSQRPSTHSMFDKVKSQSFDKLKTKVNPFDKLRVDAERSPAPSGAGRSRSIKSTIQNSKLINPQLLTAGLLLGLAFLFKVVAIFDFLTFLSFFIIINLPRKVKLSLLKEKELSTFIAGFLIPILITVFYFWMQGALIDFIRATFSSNIGYVAWQNKLILPLGLLLLKTALLLIAIIFIVGKRRALSLNAIFILLWFAFSLFNAFFTQRPYTHYLLILLPSFVLMIGLILWEKKYQKPIALFFILAFVLILKNFNFYGKTITYYQNFVSFLIGGKSVISYRAFFDKRTPIDYEIATFLKGKVRKKGSIFIWGNSAAVYKLVGVAPPGKYIVAYHIRDNEDGVESTKEAIEKIKTKFIIVMPDQEPFPFQLMRYSEKIIIDDVSIYERFL